MPTQAFCFDYIEKCVKQINSEISYYCTKWQVCKA